MHEDNTIVYRKSGIAERVGYRIYLHKDLQKYPYLQKQLLKHEYKHHPEKGIIYNILVDLFSLLMLFDLEYDFWFIWFMLTTPSSWNHFLVYEKEKNTLYPGLLISYILMLWFIWVIYAPVSYYVLVILAGIQLNNIL